MFISSCGGRNFILSSWIGGLKRAMSVALKSQRLWQPAFFDHILRNEESYAEKWNYVRDNPVRAGLVELAENWPYHGEVIVIDRAWIVVRGISPAQSKSSQPTRLPLQKVL